MASGCRIRHETVPGGHAKLAHTGLELPAPRPNPLNPFPKSVDRSSPRSTPLKPVTATMAGLVKQVLTPVGATVQAGDDVVLLESMKMEIAVPSEVAGTVAAVRV